LLSDKLGRPVDARGEPVPWYTYPAIAYLTQLDFSESRVFEFGSGSSTLFWQSRAKRVVAVEHDSEWRDRLAPMVDPTTTTIVIAAEEEAYVSAVDNFEHMWDVVAVDGLHRAAAAERAMRRLAPGGILILDNSDWFPAIAARLRDAELLEIDFHGSGPLNYYTWTTSLFFDRSARPVSRRTQPLSTAGAIPYPGPSLPGTG
jgi:hypothetical protein